MAKFYTGDNAENQNQAVSNTELTNKIVENSKKDTVKEKLIEKIISNKFPYEADSVSCLYSNPELYEEGIISPDMFSNNYFKVMFIIFGLVYDKGYSIQEDSIFKVLGEHPGLKKVYEDNGGYSFIEGMKRPLGDNTVSIDSFRADVRGLKKWDCVLSFANKGFPMDTKLLKTFADMESDEEVFDYYFLLCDVAGENVEGSNQIHDAMAEIDDIVDNLDEEVDRGCNFGVGDSFGILNQILTGGFHLNGNVYGLGAISGAGKSTLATAMLLPMAFASREEIHNDHESKKIMFLVNEEGAKKWEKDIIIWIVNNVPLPGKPEGYFLNKSKFGTGGFTDQDKKMLRQARDWWKCGNESNVYIVPLKTYSVDNVIKEIKRSKRRYGIDIFCIDTLKESRDTMNVETWKAMERDMVRLYDTVKPEGLNVALFVTYQLAKQARKMRYLTESEIGQAKNIVDVMSVNLIVRKAFPDEYSEGPKAIGINRKDESGQLIKSPELKEGRTYTIMFVNKNRFGQTDPYQIVAEINHGCLKYQEIGTTYIPTDF